MANPTASPSPAPRPGLMSNLGNSSWWNAMLQGEDGPALLGLLSGLGSQLSQQSEPPRMKNLPDPRNLHLVAQALRQFEEEERRRRAMMGLGPNGLPPGMGGAHWP